ncbi:four-carbon acid sugar kinase family protein [Actinomadura nitritigenes]|uniref:four-carbon acid sugar kinase family protein n=1 Tax=Actinomadura nitritigenes TaxID=134602 RepID=UPI003D91AED3
MTTLPAVPRRVIVLDDDPTGTQTSSGIDVILCPGRDALRAWFDGGEHAVFVLTNTRALAEEDAVRLLREIRDDADEIASARGERVAYVLRGDSTLRGHVFPEIGVFTGNASVTLFVPAFPQGGRATLGGVQYLLMDGALRPVAETEFAQDPVFGFTGLTIGEWAAGHGAGPVRQVGLEDLHRQGPAAVREALITAEPGTIVVPDAVTEHDVAAVTAGLLEAEAAGRAVVVRSSATLASQRAGVRARRLDTVPTRAAHPRLLVVCGSHTAASTAQLDALAAEHGTPVTVPTDAALAEEPAVLAGRLVPQLAERLRAGGVAVLCTERRRRPEHGTLDAASRVMRALTTVAGHLRREVDGVVVKGGISSAEIARTSFGARRARVLGQVMAGVPVWELDRPDAAPLPYVVVPGNVGGPDTLSRALAALRAA